MKVMGLAEIWLPSKPGREGFPRSSQSDFCEYRIRRHRLTHSQQNTKALIFSYLPQFEAPEPHLDLRGHWPNLLGHNPSWPKGQ